jgi:hypothetical protein
MLYRYACSLQGQGVKRAVAQAAIIGAAHRCIPPYSDGEAVDILNRVYDNFGDPLAAIDGHALDGDEPQDPSQRRSFRLLTAAEMKALPPPELLIDGVLFRDTIAVLDGASGSFKSFVAIDMTLSVATGMPWQGREVHQGAVVYICAEGSRGMTQRIRAWEIAHRQEAPSHCYFLPEAVNFLDTQAVKDLCEVIRGLREPPVFIVADTLARSMPGGDENASKDMGLAVAAMDALRRAAGGATVLSLHHVNRAKGEIRGHSSLLGAIDTELKMAKTNASTATLSCMKQKDAAEFKPMALVTRQIVLPDGETSLAFVKDSCWVSPQNLTRDRVLELLDQYFGDGGATYTQWKTVCQEHGIAETTFLNMRKLLEEAKLVYKIGPERGGRYVPRAVQADVA